MIPSVRETLLTRLSEDERGSLYGIGLTRSFPRGTALMRQGEPDDRVMILLDGRVKVARLEQDGRGG